MTCNIIIALSQGTAIILNYTSLVVANGSYNAIYLVIYLSEMSQLSLSNSKFLCHFSLEWVSLDLISFCIEKKRPTPLDSSVDPHCFPCIPKVCFPTQ